MTTALLERRACDRITVRVPATIIVPAGVSASCLVADISEGGARVLIRDIELPEVFVLQFMESGRCRHCRVVWRRNGEMGVAFTDGRQVNFGRREPRR